MRELSRRYLGPLACTALLSACASGTAMTPVADEPPAAPAATANSARPTPDPVPPSADWAENTLRGMTLREKVGQLMMPRIGGEYLPVGTGNWDRTAYWVRDLKVGGVIVTVGPPLEMAVKLNM